MNFTNEFETLEQLEKDGGVSLILDFYHTSGLQRKFTITKENLIERYKLENIEQVIHGQEAEINYKKFVNSYAEYYSQILTHIENVGTDHIIKILHKDGLSTINLKDISEICVPNINELKQHLLEVVIKYS